MHPKGTAFELKEKFKNSASIPSDTRKTIRHHPSLGLGFDGNVVEAIASSKGYSTWLPKSQKLIKIRRKASLKSTER